MSFPFRTQLVAENTIFWTQQAVLKERIWVKSVLEENIRTVPFTTGGSLRLFCVGILSNLLNEKRVEQFCSYLLENYIDADSTFPPHVWSECTASSLRTINACQLFHAHFNALFHSAHHKLFVVVSALHKEQNEKYIKMKSVTTRRFKKSATFKQEDLIASKSGQYRVNLISIIEFISSVPYKFLSNTHLYFLIACIHDDTCTSITVHVIAQKITDTTHVKPQWAKRYEIGSYTF